MRWPQWSLLPSRQVWRRGEGGVRERWSELAGWGKYFQQLLWIISNPSFFELPLWTSVLFGIQLLTGQESSCQQLLLKTATIYVETYGSTFWINLWILVHTWSHADLVASVVWMECRQHTIIGEKLICLIMFDLYLYWMNIHYLLYLFRITL